MLVKPEVKELYTSYGKPRKPVTSNNSIKDVRPRAGVNISLYEIHISRSSSSSKARNIGISVRDIKRSS